LALVNNALFGVAFEIAMLGFTFDLLPFFLSERCEVPVSSSGALASVSSASYVLVL
jgi:hypothetical protein